MTTAFDTEMLALALEMIEEFGKLVDFEVRDMTLSRITSGLVNPTPTTEQRKISPPEGVTNAYQESKEGTLDKLPEYVQMGDLTFDIAASGIAFTPIKSMKVTIDTVVWTMIGVEPIYSGDDIAMYTVFARK